MNHPATTEALRALAIAEITAERWTYVSQSLVARRDSEPVTGIDEALALLPDGAQVVYAIEDIGGSSSIFARLDDGAVAARLERGLVHLTVAGHSIDVVRDVTKALAGRVPAPPPTDRSTVELAVWSKTPTGVQSQQTTITVPTWGEIERNYPVQTRTRLARLMRHRSETAAAGGRLILLHGPPGTGKTYAIRALLSEWRDWCEPGLVVDPEVALHDSEYLRQLLERKGDDRWRLVICEDADRFIRTNNRSTDNGVLDRLLNATDGLLGQASRTLFLLTTNIELATINPALSRPGRCLSAIPFDLFTSTEARQWFEEPESAPPGSVALAQLYARRDSLEEPVTERHAVHGQYL